MAHPVPRNEHEIYEDYQQRKRGLLKALTDDSEQLFQLAEPSRDNLCLYGLKDASWSVDLPAEEVPAELPEPCLGINFARDGMNKRDWLALVAAHSDVWLLSVAFFYGVKLDQEGRARLFMLINQDPTLFEVVTTRQPRTLMKGVGAAATAVAAPGMGPPGGGANAPPQKKKKVDRPTESKTRSGRLLREEDLTPALKGRQAEVLWPDTGLWYLVEIRNINPKTKQANIVYATGEEEDLNMEEIIRDEHMTLLPLM